MDDVFWEVAAKDKEMIQEILRVIIGDDQLTVLEVHVQVSLKNLYGRSVILDTVCILGSGKKCTIEIQKGDNDDHLRRVRFNTACLTTSVSEVSTTFKEVPDVCSVYISRFDLFRKGRSLYHVDKVVRETGERIDDGQYEYYANTEACDGSRVSKLMECFEQKTVDNPDFPKVTARVREIKGDEGGNKEMCDVMEKLVTKAKIETTIDNSVDFNISKEDTIIALMKRHDLSREEAETAYDSRINLHVEK